VVKCSLKCFILQRGWYYYDLLIIGLSKHSSTALYTVEC
jgi:hypothetical protein